jgi:hypothetical protein
MERSNMANKDYHNVGVSFARGNSNSIKKIAKEYDGHLDSYGNFQEKGVKGTSHNYSVPTKEAKDKLSKALDSHPAVKALKEHQQPHWKQD